MDEYRKVIANNHRKALYSAALTAFTEFKGNSGEFSTPMPAIIFNPYLETLFYGDADKDTEKSDNVAYIHLYSPRWRGYAPKSGEDVEMLVKEFVRDAIEDIVDGIMDREGCVKGTAS